MGNVAERKFAVITGASSGIGLELARVCAAHGFDVLVCAEDAAIADVAAGIDPRAVAVQADLTTREGVDRLAAAIRGTGRPVDALLLNAGVGAAGRGLETDLEAELKMFALHCDHTIHVAKLIVPAMVARGKGRVLVTRSVVDAAAAPYPAVCGAIKAFVMSFAEALRVEIAGSGVTVTTLQPGATDPHAFEAADMLGRQVEVEDDEEDDPSLVASRGFEAMMDGKDAMLGGRFKRREELRSERTTARHGAPRRKVSG